MRRSHAVVLGLFILYLVAVGLRLLPTLETGLMYTYDSWEDAGRIVPALKSGFFPTILPHGPLFYVLVLQWCVISGMSVFQAFLWLIPFISSTLVLSVFLLTRKMTGDEHAGFYSSLFAATASFLLHWTSTPVPEAVGLTYIIFIVYLLYRTISDEDSRDLLMLVLSYFAAVLAHNLTPLLFLAGLSILGLDALISRKKGWKLVPLYMFLSFVPATLIWWNLAIADWTIGVIERMLSVASPMLALGAVGVGLFFVAILYVVNRKECLPLSGGRELAFALALAGSTACLLLVVVVFLSMQTNFNLPLGYVFIYGASHMALIYFPAWLGFVLFFNRNREPWKRMFSLSWCLGAYSVDLLLVFASFWVVIIYRTFSFLILVGLPLLGYGYSFLSRLGSPRWRPVQGVAIAYLAILLVPLAFPSASLAFGSDEFYKTSEYWSAVWMKGHLLGETMLDSDHRMGKMLRYVTGQFAWLGNESSWIAEVTQSGEITVISPSLEYLVITSTMVEYLVTDGVEQQGKPVTPRIMHYLVSSSYINLIYSSAYVSIFRNSYHDTLIA